MPRARLKLPWPTDDPTIMDMQTNAGERTRTSTGFNPHMDLNHARLPIPPHPQYVGISLDLRQTTRKNHNHHVGTGAAIRGSMLHTFTSLNS